MCYALFAMDGTMTTMFVDDVSGVGGRQPIFLV